MRLTRPAGLGVFACIHLADSSKKSQSGAEIAAALNVPVDSILRALQGLVRTGVLKSSRGRGGGFSLAKPASEISLLEIVEPLQGPIVSDFTGLKDVEGNQANKARLEQLLQETSLLTHRLLANTSVQDLLSSPER